MVEHLVAIQKVASSNLVSRSMSAFVAQLVEQLICNQQVAGSNPVKGSINGGVIMEKEKNNA